MIRRLVALPPPSELILSGAPPARGFKNVLGSHLCNNL